jgi:hypothetical protein
MTLLIWESHMNECVKLPPVGQIRVRKKNSDRLKGVDLSLTCLSRIVMFRWLHGLALVVRLSLLSRCADQ